jgi:lysophospholipase L1-like esterase
MYTSPHGITVPDGNDLIADAAEQFKQMADSIDGTLDAFPASITDVVTDAKTAAEKARDEAEQFAAQGGQLQDEGISRLLRDPNSSSSKALNGDVALWIGDSFTEGYQASSPAKRFTTLVSQKMNWSEVNVAVGGSGFIEPGPKEMNYLAQAQQASSQGIEPDVILISGGQNDASQDPSSAAGAFFDYLTTTWPLARIVVIPGTWNAKAVEPRILTHATAVIAAARSRHIEVLPGAWTWLHGRPELIASDSTHPNDAGYKVMAEWIVQGLLHNLTLPTIPAVTVSGASNYTADGSILKCSDGIVTFSGWFNKSSNAAYLDKVCTLPVWAAPSKALFVQLFTNGGNNTVLGKVETDGAVTLATFPQGVSSKQVIIPPTTWNLAQ